MTKPGDGELEVSIFGPGIGECVVVHLGLGKWMIVDSCLNPETRRPVALEYLEMMGVDCSTSVAVVMVTHWHDDHTKGAAEVLDACHEAKFCCSRALCKTEFFQAIASSTQLTLKGAGGSGIDEMDKIFKILAARKQGTKSGRFASPEWVAEYQKIFVRQPGRLPGCSVEALSPSSMAQTRAMLSFAPVRSQPKRSLPNPGPNETSVVLHIQFGAASALLGADLETGSNDQIGWRGVVRDVSLLPSTKASIVKVAHHGSDGAHHPPAWATLIAGDAVAAVTPFTSSKLPKPADVTRLKTHVRELFHTSPRPAKAAKLDNMTRKSLGGITIRERLTTLGHIRFRVDAGGVISRELFGAAAAV